CPECRGCRGCRECRVAAVVEGRRARRARRVRRVGSAAETRSRPVSRRPNARLNASDARKRVGRRCHSCPRGSVAEPAEPPFPPDSVVRTCPTCQTSSSPRTSSATGLAPWAGPTCHGTVRVDGCDHTRSRPGRGTLPHLAQLKGRLTVDEPAL